MISTQVLQEIRALLADASHCSTGADECAAHACDAWPVAIKQRQAGEGGYAPDVVVWPDSLAEVQRMVECARRHGTALTAWGLGSSVVGAPLSVRGGIALDMSRMNRLLHLDKVNQVVVVEAGMQGGVLEELLNAGGMTTNFSPQSLSRSTVGGWVATRATGQFSSRYGGIEDSVVAIQVVLADGSVVDTLALPRMSVGPDIKSLFIGAEGCLGIVTQVTLRIYPKAETRLLTTLDFADVTAAVACMRAIMVQGLRPFLLRCYDLDEARFAMRDPEYPTPVMFVGCEGLDGMARMELASIVQIAGEYGGKVAERSGAEDWMARRFDFSAVEDVLKRPGGVAETIEVSHHWQGIVATHALLKERLQPYARHVLGHFSHAYLNGVSLYVILVGEEPTLADARRQLDEIWRVAMECALASGAAIAHHHGTGLARSPYIHRALGHGHDVLHQLKQALDPEGILNPGKLGFS